MTSINMGAIRWDGFHGGQGTGLNYYNLSQNQIQKAKWQYRAPWFTTIRSKHQMNCLATQSNMDLEIQLAAQAGLKYWAYDWYTPEVTTGNSLGYSLMYAWGLHQASSYKNLMKWCITCSLGSLMGASNNFGTVGGTTINYNTFAYTSAWQAHINQIVTWMQQSNYVKVTAGGVSNRPLMYWLWSPSEIYGWLGAAFQSSGNYTPTNSATAYANLNTVMSYLTTQLAAVGLGAPYIGMIGGWPATSAQIISYGVGSAITGYNPVLTSGGNAAYNSTTKSLDPIPWTTYDAGVQGWWASCAAAGKTIPSGCTGWDTRDEYENEMYSGTKPFAGKDCNYVTPPTPAQLATSVQNQINFIIANPTTCETNTGLIYSWTECSEGGNPLVPTIGDPPTTTDTGQPLLTTAKLAAIGPILRNYV